MNQFYQLLTILPVLVWCASRETVRSIHRFLVAQAIGCLIELIATPYGESSWPYIFAFLAANMVIIRTMLELAWLSPCPLIAWLLSLLMAIAAGLLAAYSNPKGLFDWIAIAVGSVTLLCAIPIGWGAAYLSAKEKRIALVFSSFWLLEAIFQYGLTRFANDPTWARINDFFPCAETVILCCLVTRLSARKENHVHGNFFGSPR